MAVSTVPGDQIADIISDTSAAVPVASTLAIATTATGSTSAPTPSTSSDSVFVSAGADSSSQRNAVFPSFARRYGKMTDNNNDNNDAAQAANDVEGNAGEIFVEAGAPAVLPTSLLSIASLTTEERELLAVYRTRATFGQKIGLGLIDLLRRDAAQEEVAAFVDSLASEAEFPGYRAALVTIRENWPVTANAAQAAKAIKTGMAIVADSVLDLDLDPDDAKTVAQFVEGFRAMPSFDRAATLGTLALIERGATREEAAAFLGDLPGGEWKARSMPSLQSILDNWPGEITARQAATARRMIEQAEAIENGTTIVAGAIGEGGAA